MNHPHVSRWPDDPGSHIAFPHRAPRRFPDRGSRRRNAVNRLLCAVAVAGIGAACWGFWLEYDEHRDRAASEKAISEACGDVVNPAAVMDLGGGIVRAKAGSSDDDRFDLDPPTAPGACEIYRVGKPGTSYGYFALAFTPRPNEEYGNIVGAHEEEPFGDRYDRRRPDDITSAADYVPDQPLGDDGSLGSFDDDSVSVTAVCSKPTSKAGLTSLTVDAKAMYEETQTSKADRARLADIAVRAARKAADRLGCATEVPDAPDTTLDVPSSRLVPAERADGTCAWYPRLLRTSARGNLPDRALATPAAGQAMSERCLLALSPSAAGRAARASGVEADDGIHGYDPWWLALDSWFGDEAKIVYSDAGITRRSEQRHLAPGTTGGHPEASVWWASSVCRGIPAVHTLTVADDYDKVARKRLGALFRAYVDDVAARRGCVDVKFPKSADFVKE
ncbi:hypothetical protein ABT010_35965 [Streptomyces sp. NPDC002668]|uniref:hypothetical protein n=1 Tax=Streptomyces sp. NPDC002668 TaxID=3154422 RepID=UPI003333234D